MLSQVPEIVIYLLFATLGWWLRHKGVLAPNTPVPAPAAPLLAESTHPLLTDLEKAAQDVMKKALANAVTQVQQSTPK